MSTRMKLAALAVLSVTQLAAAGWSIARYESILRTGALYRIRTMPVDPADAFRGRYVAVRPGISILNPISPEAETVLQRLQAGEKGYVVLTTGADGFATAAEVVLEPPGQGDYLRVERVWPRWPQQMAPGATPTPVGYNIEFAFNRYYMNETSAPAAEQRYRDTARRNDETRAWLNVRVKDGTGVIEGLYIDGRPIEEIAAQPPAQ